MAMIEIWDRGVSLDDLLRTIPTTDDLKWSILEFWGTAQNDMNVVALEERAAASSTGLEMTAAELRHFASGLLQFIDGIVVGYVTFGPNRSSADLRASSAVVIEAIDSTFWRVYADDRKVVDAVRRVYDDVRSVEPERPVAPVHEDS